jgi:hypothetical protein
VASPDNPEPCGHALTGDGGDRTMTPGLHFAMDRLAMNVLAIKAMGLHLLDYLQFEELVPLCEEADRWTFLCVIAPLRLPSATGSPVNPIAIL